MFIELLKSLFSHKLLKLTKSFGLTNVEEKTIVLIIKNNNNIRIRLEIKPMKPNENFKNI